MSTSTERAAAGVAVQVPRKAVIGTLIAVCSAVFVAQADSSMPAPLNGLFQADLGATGNQLTWITSAFMISVVVFEFTFGVLGDLFGRKKLVLGGTAVVLVGNVICATATSPHALWIGAGLNGLGAGAMIPGSLAMVAAVTHSAQSRARAVAIWAGFLSLGGSASPLIGGLFAHYGTWRGAFWVLAAGAALSIVLMALLGAESSAPEGRKLDVPGQTTFAIGLILVLFALVQAPSDGWGSTKIVSCLVIGALFLGGFLVIEARSTSPILHLDLFKNRSFAVASIVAVVGMSSYVGVGYTLSMWMGPGQQQDPLRMAVVFVTLPIPVFVLIPVMSRLLRVVSPLWMLSCGFGLMAIGTFWYTTLDINNDHIGPFIPPTLVVGIGFAMALNSVTAVAINAVPIHLAGMASATINMIRDLGFSLGPVVISAVALSKASDLLASSLPGSGLPAGVTRTATAINQAGGAVAVNGVPPGQPGSAAHALALDSLGRGLHLGFAVCAAAAAAAAVVTLVGMARSRSARVDADALVDPLHTDLDNVPDF